MAKKLVAIRMDEDTLQKLEQLVAITGWTQTDLLHRLIDNAKVTPPAVITDLTAKKGQALAGAMAS